MYCRNCGRELPVGATVCPSCGVPAGCGRRYCPNCGSQTDEMAVICVKCNCPLQAQQMNAYKSKTVAGILGILLGSLGIHNFYLGYTQRGLIQLLVTIIGGVFTCGIAAIAMYIWGLVEGIQILTGSIAFDANGMPLKD